MIHSYYTIRDKVAEKFVHVCESENDQTMARMCNILEKDEKGEKKLIHDVDID